MVLLFDRKYYLRFASFLEESRRSLGPKSCLNLSKECLIIDGYFVAKYFCENMLDPRKFNSYIYNMRQLISKGEDSQRLGIYEKLIILEGIKRKIIDIEEVRKQYKSIPGDISLWSNI